MAGLTPTEVKQMMSTLADLRQSRGVTFLLVEHVMDALMQLSDRIMVLEQGESIAIGSADEISRNDRVLEVYFG